QGFIAVPQLIAALDDRRLTRTLYGWFDWQMEPGWQVQLVGTRVVGILERISGQTFQPDYYQKPTAPKLLIDAVKPKVLAWWATVKDRREVDVLKERVLAGDYYGAIDMAKRFPAAFTSALRTYLSKGGDDSGNFTSILGSVHTLEAAKLAE